MQAWEVVTHEVPIRGQLRPIRARFRTPTLVTHRLPAKTLPAF